MTPAVSAASASAAASSAPVSFPPSVSDKIPPFPPFRVPPRPWHIRAWALWHLLPSVATPGLAWILGVQEDALEKAASMKGWPSRLVTRRQAAAEAKGQRVTAELAIPVTTPECEYDPPPVSLTRMVRVIERKAELEMERSNPVFMSAWLSNLAAVDSAIRARAARRSTAQAKSAVRIYLPRQDAPQPGTSDAEDAVVVPPPVVF